MGRSAPFIWVIYQVILPLLGLIAGLITCSLSKTHIPFISLLDGVALGLYAVALVASAVFGFESPSPPPVSQTIKQISYGALSIIVIISTVLVSIYVQNSEESHNFFLVTQFLLVMVALPISYMARP